MLTRREFIHKTGAAAAFARMPRLAAAKYDLLVKGGRVVDPSQRVDRVADVAIRSGRIVSVQPNLAAGDAAEVIDATGRIVTPGLVDLHVHATEDIPAFALSTGVTTMLDAGTRGADGVADRVDMVKGAPNRVRVLLNLSRQGVTTPGELLNFDTADVDAAKRAIEPHRDVIVGVKARLSRSVAGDHDLDAVRRAKAVTAAFKLPIMVHIGDSASPLPKILELLDRGDIVTHVYAPINGILDGNGRVWPQVLEARRRGVMFDFGNGRLEHFTWESVERGVQQRFLPDTISSDLTVAGRTDRVYDFPTVLSKFLLLGLTLNEVIARATINAARVIPAFKEFGTLKPGAVADVAVFDLKEGAFEFLDNENAKRTGQRKLVAQTVIASGKRV
jgi:dihydroorotase